MQSPAPWLRMTNEYFAYILLPVQTVSALALSHGPRSQPLTSCSRTETNSLEAVFSAGCIPRLCADGNSHLTPSTFPLYGPQLSFSLVALSNLSPR